MPGCRIIIDRQTDRQTDKLSLSFGRVFLHIVPLNKDRRRRGFLAGLLCPAGYPFPGGLFCVSA